VPQGSTRCTFSRQRDRADGEALGGGWENTFEKRPANEAMNRLIAERTAAVVKVA
jgi:hypothetical protein